MTQETNDVVGRLRISARAYPCEVVGHALNEAADLIQSQSARIAEQDALLEWCARGFEKHARHWRASQARTDSLEDGARAKNADALADLARSSLTKDSTSG